MIAQIYPTVIVRWSVFSPSEYLIYSRKQDVKLIAVFKKMHWSKKWYRHFADLYKKGLYYSKICSNIPKQ